MPKELIIKLPLKLKPIFSSQHRYVVIYGGRGSAKSWSVGGLFIVNGYQQKKRYLCTREYQNTIKESVHRLLADTIQRFGLDSFYKIKDDSIVGKNGTEFIFKGLRKDPDGIKSMEDLDAAWVEEAHTISRKSLDILIPTVRKKGSQIFFTYNPTDKEDPVHVDYTLSNKPNVLRIECNYNDNPFFPDVLHQEMEWDRANDIDKYYHVWCGQCVQHSEAQIFYGKWIIEDFEKWETIDNQYQQTFPPRNTFFYFGSDYGYGQDPATLNRCFVLDNTLYIDYEFHGIGIDIDKLPSYYATIPESANYPITGDSSRPDTIAYIRARGFPKIKSSIKGKGSIEDGIAFMRSFEKIKVHPRCKHTIDEFRLYSYIIDPKTGQISSKIEDKHNHHIDNLRYALEDLMRMRQVTAVRSIAR
jgi:phage terminase large subunit